MKNNMFQSKALTCQVSNCESARLCHLEGGPAGYKSVSMFPEVKGEPTKEELKDKDKSLENPETPDGRNAIRAQSILYLRKYQLDAEAREALDILDSLIQKSVRAEVRTPEPNTNPPEVADKIVAATELKAQLEGIRTIYVKSANNKKTLKQEPLTIPEDPEFPEGRNKIRSDAQEVLLKTKETAENKDNLEQIRFLLKLSYYAETGELYKTLDKADKAYDGTVGEKTAKDAAYDKVFSEAFGKGTLPTLSSGEYKKENKDLANIEINDALSKKIAPYKEAPATAPTEPSAPAPKTTEATKTAPPATPAEDSLEKGVERDNFRSKVQRWLNKYKYETETNELRDLLRESMKAENNVPDDNHEGLILPYDRSNDRIPRAKALKEKFDTAVVAHTADGKETAPTALTLENPNAVIDAEGRNLIRQKAIDWLAKNPNHTEAANVRLLLHNSQRAERNMQAVTYDANNNEILFSKATRDGNGDPYTILFRAIHEESTTPLREKLVKLGAGGPAAAEQPAPATPAKVEPTPPPKKEAPAPTPKPEPVKPAVPETPAPAPTVVPAIPEPPAPTPTAAAPAAPEAPATAPAITTEEEMQERHTFRQRVGQWLYKYKYEAETFELRDLLNQSMRTEEEALEKVVIASLKVKFDAAIAAHKDANGKEIAPKGLTLDNENITKFPEGIELIHKKAHDWLEINKTHPLAKVIDLLLKNSEIAATGGSAIILDDNGKEVPLLNEEGNPIKANIGSTNLLRRQLAESKDQLAKNFWKDGAKAINDAEEQYLKPNTDQSIARLKLLVKNSLANYFANLSPEIKAILDHDAYIFDTEKDMNSEGKNLTYTYNIKTGQVEIKYKQ